MKSNKNVEEIITPNVITAYKYFQNITCVYDLLEEYKKAKGIAIHCAVRMKRKFLVYFHHFIITSIAKTNDIYELTIIHKASADIGSSVMFSAIGFDSEFCKIKEEKIIIDASDNNVIDGNKKMMNFKIGRFYVLGDYTETQRINCLIRAKEECKKKSREYYSLESANCEHFVTYCFQGIGKSFQSDIRKKRAAQGDAAIDVVTFVVKDGIQQGTVAGVKVASDKVVKNLILEAPKVVINKGTQVAQRTVLKTGILI